MIALLEFTKVKSYFKNMYVLSFQINNKTYSENEAREEFFSIFKEGWSAIYMEHPFLSSEEEYPIVDVWISEQEEDLLIDSGYLFFEYKE